MKLTKKTLFAALAVAVGSFALPAHATSITGAISFGGGDQVLECTGECSDTTMTGITFDTENDPVVLSSNGNLATTFGTAASFADIDFSSLGLIWTVNGFSFTANDVYYQSYTPAMNSADLTGYEIRFTGVLEHDSYDPTPGNFIFTGNDGRGDMTASWSASQTAVRVPVPVPASAALLGIGLLGLAGIARRRRA